MVFQIRGWEMGERGDALIATRRYARTATLPTDLGFQDLTAVPSMVVEGTVIELVHAPT